MAESGPVYQTRIREMPENERPRERLEHYGAHELSVPELLAIALRTGSQHESAIGLGQRLNSAYKNLSDLGKASVRELCQLKGIGPAKATQILAAIELGRRVCMSSPERPRITSPGDAASYVRGRMGQPVQEQLWVVLLDTKHRVQRAAHVYTGNVNSSVVRVGEIFREAVKDNATAIIVAHNHPSGDPTPSPDDVQVTEAIVEAGKLLDIAVLDHLILGEAKHVSLKEKGLGSL
jgi:DNA repair protein RadC